MITQYTKISLLLISFVLFTIQCKSKEAKKNETSESFWGRLYVSNGVYPIQFFRDKYGGDLPIDEQEFYFPTNTIGCENMSADEEAYTKKNHPIIFFDRGQCTFETKSRIAQAAGASALVIISNTEHVIRPSAILDEMLNIGTVMIKKSAGTQLRAANKREKLFGRLIPLVCAKASCKIESLEDQQYTENSLIRGGKIQINEESIGEFLTASYGAPIISKPLHVARSIPEDGCDTFTNIDIYTEKAVLINRGNCNLLEKISNAQIAGAEMALILTTQEFGSLFSPRVNMDYEAYNITIPSAMIMIHDHLIHSDIFTENPIHLIKENKVAISWAKIEELASFENWPTRKNRREIYLRQLITENQQFPHRAKVIGNYFIQVAGGSPEVLKSILDEFKTNQGHQEL